MLKYFHKYVKIYDDTTKEKQNLIKGLRFIFSCLQEIYIIFFAEY